MIIHNPYRYVPKKPSRLLSTDGIARIETHYSATYIRDSELLVGKVWRGLYAIFYTEKPDISQGHSHYFGIYVRDGVSYILNGKDVTEPQKGIWYKNKFYFSAYSSDYTNSDDGECGIDGGRTYYRIIGKPDLVCDLKINKDILYFGG